MENRLRQCLKEDIRSRVSNKKVAVFLSGGVDSTCCLLSCVDLGLDITAYTFYLQGHVSQDLLASRAITKKLGIKLKEVVVPYSIDRLKEDAKRIIKEYKTTKKTAVQCIHPFLYIMPQVKENDIVSGLYADDLYGTSRKGNIIGHNSKQEFDVFRKNQIAQQDYSCVYIKECAKRHGKNLVTPFIGGTTEEYLMGLDWNQMNGKRPKEIAIKAFDDYYRENAWYRKNSNLQVNSGIREYHDLLLKTDLNKRNHRSVVGVYNDIQKGIV